MSLFILQVANHYRASILDRLVHQGKRDWATVDHDHDLPEQATFGTERLQTRLKDLK